MYSLIIISISLYIISLFLILVVGVLKQKKKEYSSFTENGISLDDITLVIPFRNEGECIGKLIDSLNNSIRLPGRIIFVDDHSSDNTCNEILKQTSFSNYEVIKLSTDISGKKMAIRKGIEGATSTYIYTMDADVTFSPFLFTRIAQLMPSDLYVLPVSMKSKSWYTRLFELDYILVNCLNTGISGWKRPIMASGANLLFNRELFLSVDSINEHQHIASGDDVYTLRDFRLNNKQINLISNDLLSVETETPQSISELVNQRLRWVSKTVAVKDSLSTATTSLQAVITFLYFTGLIYLAIKGMWSPFIYLFALKCVIDMLACVYYFNQQKRMITWLFIPLYEFLLPFYTLLLLILMFFIKPKWKGREVLSK